MVIGGWWIYRLGAWSFENAVRFARLTLYALRFTLDALRLTLYALRLALRALDALRSVPLYPCTFSIFTIAYCLFPIALLCAFVPLPLFLSLYAERLALCAFLYSLLPIPSCLPSCLCASAPFLYSLFPFSKQFSLTLPL